MDSEKSKLLLGQVEVLSQVDTHFHVFEAGQSLPGARYTPGYPATYTAWQAAATRAGVTHGVLVQTSFMGTNNQRLLAELAQHPDTLRGVAVVSPDATLAELRALHAHGVRGIRLNVAGRMEDISHWSAATALWDALLQLGWHVELHTDTGGLPVALGALPQALPVVVDHFGKPNTATPQDATVKALKRRALSGAAGHTISAAPTTYIKLSAAYRLHTNMKPCELAQLWLAELGPDALLWGSDWPCTNYEAQADYAALHASLTDWLVRDVSVLQTVRSVNPMRLYWGV